MLKIDEALKELATKSHSQIQTETAWKWASRAAACFNNVLSASVADKVVHMLAAEEYYHEALEHAALAGGDFLKEIDVAMEPYASAAIRSLGDALGKIP